MIILEIAVSVLSMKNIFIRKLLNGKSIVIIKDGVIDQQAMSDVRMTVVDLIELLRGQNVFDISTVAFAVLEVNGELSVLLKSKEQPATLKDLRIEKSEAVLPLPVITDGKILNETLKALNVSEEMVYKQLKKNNTNVKKVFLMTMDKDGNSTIINKGKKV